MIDSVFLTNLLIGPLLLMFALIFKAFPPKKRNWIYGYRTSRSQKSQKAWDAANRYSTNLMIYIAIITILAQIVFYSVLSPSKAILLACLLTTILLIGVIPMVENHLKKLEKQEKKEDS